MMQDANQGESSSKVWKEVPWFANAPEKVPWFSNPPAETNPPAVAEQDNKADDALKEAELQIERLRKELQQSHADTVNVKRTKDVVIADLHSQLGQAKEALRKRAPQPQYEVLQLSPDLPPSKSKSAFKGWC